METDWLPGTALACSTVPIIHCILYKADLINSDFIKMKDEDVLMMKITYDSLCRSTVSVEVQLQIDSLTCNAQVQSFHIISLLYDVIYYYDSLLSTYLVGSSKTGKIQDNCVTRRGLQQTRQ